MFAILLSSCCQKTVTTHSDLKTVVKTYKNKEVMKMYYKNRRVMTYTTHFFGYDQLKKDASAEEKFLE